MIRSLLVANRGEIACRIFRTARKMGMRTIAVYSDADAGARHVREADEAIRIGPPPAAESYLDIGAVLRAARAARAEAVHPGYGFLSENAQFARACLDAGLVFVGPPPDAIAAMGSKSLAKASVRAAGVPVLPGYDGERQEIEFLEARALEAGLPLIVKPAAGGGGKGMRVVRAREELREALTGARRLAESAFGDGTLLIERYLPEPRHIEVQVFADQQGNCVHLGDRDCSVQRRHQKLIEEAPAPGLPQPLRESLRAAAVLVARNIGYVSAGTVEFLFDGREFYFLEMNTRLQVEHTVTEAVTGLDLVEWQLRIAAGEPLPLSQAQIHLDGHAIEARVCAEDPWREFMPSAGSLHLAEWPQGESLRVDAGFSGGDAVPSVYDSLLAKIIAWAPAREQAASRLAHALDHTYLAGVRTNERWLGRILRSKVFLEMQHSVALLDRRAGEFSRPLEVTPAAVALAALAALRATTVAVPGAGVSARSEAASPWEVSDGFQPNLPARIELTLSSLARSYRVRLTLEDGAPREALVLAPAEKAARHDGGARLRLAGVSVAQGTVSAVLDDERHGARWLRLGAHLHVWVGDTHHEFLIEDPRNQEFSASASTGGLTTPLPGVVSAVAVKEGQAVAAGELLMVIEAMKMEHSITAPHAGVVSAIHFARGDRVPEGSELLTLSRAGDSAS
ncbi:MAG TPA: biotin carboxylase N-terminal domain-containing protein [Steroidobacteraceae bacterium]|nr:biotin carboxylase N-terminal domain-containing protein [Steroidobacteraceae bacterium]